MVWLPICSRLFRGDLSFFTRRPLFQPTWRPFSHDINFTGRAQSLPMFSQSLENTLPIALEQLGANSKSQTRKMFDRVDGLWWNSYQRVPEKFLVLTRDYDTSDNRYPLIPLQMIPTEHLRLSLPNEYRGYVLHQLAQLRLLPTKRWPNCLFRKPIGPSLIFQLYPPKRKNRINSSSDCRFKTT